jgi:tryptophan synthase alpha chain
MTTLEKLFTTKNKNILNIYVTAGYPKLNDTITIMETLQESGANIIELGMPYSDPLADGETIQKSSMVALQNGMSIAKLLQQLQTVRNTIHIPIVLMGYFNPILQFGFEAFCKQIKAAGIDALIIPDLPMYEYETTYKAILNECNIDLIFLVTPNTPNERIKLLDSLSSGFLYAVTSSSTTGSQQDFDEVAKYLQRLQSLELKNPVLAGFGISNKETFNKVNPHCNGAIIGSAFVKALSDCNDVQSKTKSFVKSILS